MSADKIGQSLRNLEQAVTRLKEALDEPETNPLAIDGTIQRFEFAFERPLRHNGLITKPHGCKC